MFEFTSCPECGSDINITSRTSGCNCRSCHIYFRKTGNIEVVIGVGLNVNISEKGNVRNKYDYLLYLFSKDPDCDSQPLNYDKLKFPDCRLHLKSEGYLTLSEKNHLCSSFDEKKKDCSNLEELIALANDLATQAYMLGSFR